MWARYVSSLALQAYFLNILKTDYLFHQNREILLNLIEEEGKKCSTILNAINECEMEHIYSMNEHYYSDKVNFYHKRAVVKRQKAFQRYETERNAANNSSGQQSQVYVEAESDPNILQQIQIASEIRAYWQVSIILTIFARS